MEHAVLFVTVGLFATAVCHENSNVTNVIDDYKCCKEGMKPAPVQNFIVDIKKHNCMAWEWNFEDPSKDYTCIMTIDSYCTEKQTKSILYSAKTGELSPSGMCRLDPYIECSLGVKCRFMVNSSVTGYWSDAISILKLNPDVPYKPPLTGEGLFEISHLNGNNSATVYFTPLKRCELHDSPGDVVYIVKWQGRTMNVSHPNFSAVIDIPVDPFVDVTIQAANSVGPSKNSSGLTIFLRQNELQSRSKLRVERNNTSDNCSALALISQIKTEQPIKYNYLSYKIVWCNTIWNSCMTPVDWVNAEANTTVILPITDCKSHFRFGLITYGCDESRGKCVSTGIRWVDSTHQTQLEESKRVNDFSSGLAFVVTLIVLFLIGRGVLTVHSKVMRRRPLGKVPSTAGGKVSGCSTQGYSLKVTSDCREADDLLGERKWKGNKNNTAEISQKNESVDEKLLNPNILPTDTELQLGCRQFGRRSKIMKFACGNICEQVKRKEGKITGIRLAYNPTKGKIVFVAESGGVLSKLPVTNFEIILDTCTNDLSKEGETVLSRESEIDYSQYRNDKFRQLQQCISTNAKFLMDKHLNINVMSPSMVKSVDYNNAGKKHKFIETPCISICIDKKVRGVIPLEEDEIPLKIDGFFTDVIEGRYKAFCNGPNDYQKYLTIGCGIHAGVTDDKGNTLGGTTCGFVEHEIHGTCCITSAHIVLPPEELQEVKKHGYLEYTIDTGRSVHQPASSESIEFGKVISVAYREGEAGKPGVEAALIKILRRHPIKGSFPHGNKDSDLSETIVFNSGNICTDYLRPMTNVFKYGMATGPTFGYIGMQGSVVRGYTHLDGHMYGIRLCDQIEIFPLKDSRFADFGDSGACLFINCDKPGQEAAIGVVVGGLENGKVFVSPIYDVLCALKCKPFMKRFKSSIDSGVSFTFPEGAIGDNCEEDMDCS